MFARPPMIDDVSNEGNAPPDADEEASAPVLPEASAAALSDAPADELELAEASALELGEASSEAAGDAGAAAEEAALGDVLADEPLHAATRRPTDRSASAPPGRSCRMWSSPR
jgi:hypothetical protein